MAPRSRPRPFDRTRRVKRSTEMENVLPGGRFNAINMTLSANPLDRLSDRREVSATR